jgi:hypothetical protein
MLMPPSISSTCVGCSAGSYGTGTGMLSQAAACINCSVGTYSAGTGASTPCSASPQPVSYYLLPSSLTVTPAGFWCGLQPYFRGKANS